MPIFGKGCLRFGILNIAFFSIYSIGYSHLRCRTPGLLWVGRPKLPGSNILYFVLIPKKTRSNPRIGNYLHYEGSSRRIVWENSLNLIRWAVSFFFISFFFFFFAFCFLVFCVLVGVFHTHTGNSASKASNHVVSSLLCCIFEPL